MNNLDDIEAIKKADPSNVLGSTALFPDQCTTAWNESQKIEFPAEYKQVKNIVVCGMGGSRFTPRTIKELFRDRIGLPYEIIEDYTVPAYVNSDSLVILSSYSGSTEEVLSAGENAVKKGAKLTGVMHGGVIADFLTTVHAPFYSFNTAHNPCGQPRIGGGYMLFGHLGILQALGFVSVTNEEIKKAIDFAYTSGKKYLAEIPEKNNVAKLFARFLKDKHPFIITAEFLKGFGNGFANQINETAKMISDYRYISELNHHLLEGLSHPESIHRNGVFVFIKSQLYSAPIQKRFTITQDVVKKQNVVTHVIELSGHSKLDQVLEAYTLSGYTTFYLGMLYDVDPVAIPWVDYFKAELAKK